MSGRGLSLYTAWELFCYNCLSSILFPRTKKLTCGYCLSLSVSFLLFFLFSVFLGKNILIFSRKWKTYFINICLHPFFISSLLSPLLLIFLCYLSNLFILNICLQWALMTMLDPRGSLANLLYIGYGGNPASALHVTRRRSVDRKKQQTERNVFHCLVFGPKNAGKSTLLNSFLGRYCLEPMSCPL